MADDQIQEFTLDGKQLAFLVISAIAVAVVVFLFGVMVGRGIRAPQTAATAAPGASGVIDPNLPVDPIAELSTSNEGRKLPDEDLRYMDRLGGPPPANALREPVAEPAAPVTPAPQAPAATPVAQKAGDTSLDEPPGPGFVVQVSSLTKRPEADAMARGLRSKGYRSWVSETTVGGLRYRVRVGKFKDRKEALAVARRLETEEQFTGAWVDEVR